MTWWDSQGFDSADVYDPVNGGGFAGLPPNVTADPGNYTTQPVGDPISTGIVPNAGTSLGTQPLTGQFQGLDVMGRVRDLVGSDYSSQHLQQILPQLRQLGVEVQNQDASGHELRPRFLLPGGEQWDFGPTGWINSGHGVQPGFGQGQTPKSGGPTPDANGMWSGSGLFGGGALDTLRNTPGYQFAKEQGLQGIERSAASRGTLLTGGTLKALDQYGTGLADQTYDSAYRRYLDLAKLGFPGYPQ